MRLVDLLFPRRCCGCSRWGNYFCALCLKNIAQTELVCPVCERASIGGATHPLCRKKYGLDGLWSLGVYRDPLRRAIQKLKYKFVADVGSALVDLMVDYWAHFSPEFLEDIKKDRGEGWVIVPVPLHPKRQKFRGFNQCSLLAQILATKIGLSYAEVLKRVRFTKPQVGMKSWERKKNIKGAFALSPNYNLKSSNCLLVDDVWTTGSTLKECTYILKRGGVKKVWAITLAR